MYKVYVILFRTLKVKCTTIIEKQEYIKLVLE
jgi:hypothetical protein